MRWNQGYCFFYYLASDHPNGDQKDCGHFLIIGFVLRFPEMCHVLGKNYKITINQSSIPNPPNKNLEDVLELSDHPYGDQKD